ncbi:MAG: Ig-like domain-containing protein, partial [Gammaproteobacteria bacterium]
MLSNFAQPILAQRLRLIGCATLAIALSACGGGGGDPGATGPTTGTGTGTGTGTTATPKVALTLVDGTGATVSTLAGGQTGVVRAKVTDAKGALVPNAVVKFTADGDLVDFVPESGSALTDANGVAVINIKPKSLTAAGALTVKAESVVAGLTGSSTINLAVGASPLTVGELSWTPAPSGKLPAFSTAALSIPVTAGGQPATSVTGLNLTSLCVGDGLATIVPGPLANGVQSATYTNNGCLRGTDTITASIGNSSKTINLAVDAASIGTIQFVSTDLAGSAIVLRGSGGLGRKESALLTYRVLDQNNKGLAGVDVSFRATTNTGGLTVQPDKGTTDANGQVTTTVSSGTIPTPVRVVAEATRNGKVISGLSDTLVISTGLPIQRSMSLSADAYNIEGWNIDGTVAKVTVRMADQYGNPISDNTAVNFVTEGGAVGSSLQGACTTTDGGCTVELRSQNFRPTNGRVTVMAYVQGVEDFVDSNGDGQYSCTTWVDPNGKATTTYRPLIDTCVAGGEPFTDMGDPYLDTGSHGSTKGLQEQKIFGTLDNSYDAGLGDQPIPYNSNSYRATGNGKWGINYIRRSAEFTFSGTTPYFVRVKCDSEGANCVDWN